jgi:syntaxin 6
MLSEINHSLLLVHAKIFFTRMLDDLEANVDRTDSKLSNAMRRMKKFVRDTEGKFEPAYM